MFSCVIVFLLLNTFYCGFGYPLALNETLGKSLQLLAESCQNNFLSIQIKSHIEPCDIILSAEREIKEAELQCLIFYDINSQLCTALRGSKLELNETYDSEIKQPQKVEKVCTDASKNWKFTNLTVYPKYYNTSQKVLKTFVTCLKACAVEDILSEDTNFFCRYYQWGSEKLQSLKVVSGDSGPGVNELKNTQTVTNQLSTQNSPSKVESLNEESQLDNDQEQTQAQIEIPKAQENSVFNQLPENGAPLNDDHLKTAKSVVSKENPPSILETQSQSAVNNTGKSLASNELTLGIRPIKDSNPKAGKDDQSPDTVDDEEDGLDGDLGDDGHLGGALGNDENDPILDTDIKPREKINNHDKNVESMPSLDIPGPQKEIYSNTMSDQFGEVDDHFFSFFLTATILVIFFYVLYHNKSKFRKVFLGLLVEGRQTGRRRNSRGHEYRRLDTLEQAMSTNSAAPPSKIIY